MFNKLMAYVLASDNIVPLIYSLLSLVVFSTGLLFMWVLFFGEGMQQSFVYAGAALAFFGLSSYMNGGELGDAPTWFEKSRLVYYWASVCGIVASLVLYIYHY